MAKTIEKRVAEELEQRPETITIAGREYKIAPPSSMTIVLVSEAVAELPQMGLDGDNLVQDVLREARNCRPLGKAVATMILGAKRIREDRENMEKTCEKKRSFFDRVFGRGAGYSCGERQETGLLGRLERELMEEATPRELHVAFADLVMRMQLGDFFGLTTFLSGVNMTKPTRKVAKTTASGR